MDGYISGSKVKELLNVSDWTLRHWADTGKIKSIRTPGGQRRYDISTFRASKRDHEVEDNRKIICYARVSSRGQKDDLQRQIGFLERHCPEGIVITDIASGINWKRKGLASILELSVQGDIREVVVAARDRLCRFAFELLERMLALHDVRITVLDSEGCSPEQELSDDLLGIVQIFCCRRNGKRRYIRRPDPFFSTPQNAEDKDEPHENPETDAE
ncbi:resolvase [Acanthocystis turfacea Chlorella virus GM0701.1]|nr:resolvase [Acanthocystis turfacea Chlorella virus GM0701.1]